jgi:hypothetical protein
VVPAWIGAASSGYKSLFCPEVGAFLKSGKVPSNAGEIALDEVVCRKRLPSDLRS